MQNRVIYLDERKEVLRQLQIENEALLTFFILHNITLNNIAKLIEMQSSSMIASSRGHRTHRSRSYLRSSSVISSLIPPTKIFFTVDCRSGREASSRGMARFGSVCRPSIV